MAAPKNMIIQAVRMYLRARQAGSSQRHADAGSSEAMPSGWNPLAALAQLLGLSHKSLDPSWVPRVAYMADRIPATPSGFADQRPACKMELFGLPHRQDLTRMTGWY